MCSRMVYTLPDGHFICHCFCCSDGKWLASTSHPDPCLDLWSCHRFDTLLHHATCIWVRGRRIKNCEADAGKGPQFGKSSCFWAGSLHLRIVGKLVDLDNSDIHRFASLQSGPSSMHLSTYEYKFSCHHADNDLETKPPIHVDGRFCFKDLLPSVLPSQIFRCCIQLSCISLDLLDR